MWYNIIWYGRTSGLQQHPQHLVQLDLRPLEVLRKKSGEREREREKERKKSGEREREREKEREREREMEIRSDGEKTEKQVKCQKADRKEKEKAGSTEKCTAMGSSFCIL